MTDYSDIVNRLRTKWGDAEAECDAANALEELQNKLAKLEVNRLYMETAAKNDEHRIAELEAEKQFILIENEKRWEECISKFQKMEQTTKELEHQMKFECDTYLWNRKRMSRRIAFLEYWMERLFKYGSSPEARRNELTMMTEIPDYLMKEGEDILHHLEETSDLEKGNE